MPWYEVEQGGEYCRFEIEADSLAEAEQEAERRAQGEDWPSWVVGVRAVAALQAIKTVGYPEKVRGQWYWRAVDRDGTTYNVKGRDPLEARQNFQLFIENIEEALNMEATL